MRTSTSRPSEVAQHARQHGFHFAVYKDLDGLVADRFGAQVTPEAFVMDSTGAIRYHGYVDDSMNASRVQNQGLRLALEAVLAGKPVPNQLSAFSRTVCCDGR